MKKNVYRQFALITLLVGGMAGCNDAVDATDDETADSLRRDSIEKADKARFDDSAALKNKDAVWLSEVLENNYAEIELAKQAQEKAANKEVKNLAATLVKDHQALVTEAKSLAKNKNWDVAAGETTDDIKKRQDLMDDEVKEYQKSWLEMMEDKHEASIKKFEGATDNVMDPDLKTWITNTVPKLKAHHEKITQVQKIIK